VARRLARRFGAEVTWLPFDLHPEYPAEGLPREELLRRYPQALHDGVERMMAERDLPYAPPPHVVSRTLDALRVSELARTHGRHDVLHDALMEAYWAHGEDLGDHDVLRRHAGAAGLPQDEVEDVLATDRFADTVAASTQEAVSLGVTGVPAFVLDGRLLVLGAQPDEVFVQAYARLEGA
jgi:predicted DsbA family dithiol-disulfide isomerase